ncbi:MAG: SMP-30/gluconolactonase/LRE family protein [Burkholderiaceae bacterium]|nr:SMP-30/gluconolactonase/LRE family protein [Burkholderiaceae bacterium]
MHHGEIEGSGFEIIDAEFAGCFVGHARLERLWTGCRWAEGPAWFGGGRYLLWSDLPNDRLLRYDDTDGSVSVFRAPAGFANGNTVDREGRLVTCEHGNRRVTRTEHDGRITVLADRHRGARLNSPNDAVVKSDGSVWFTDPDYGIVADYEGARAPREQNGCHVYRIDPDNGEVTCVADDFDHPNGLAFSRDERWLFVADSGATEGPERPRHIRRLRVNPDGRTLGDSTVFAQCPAGFFDGFRIDEADRLWASSAEGVQVYRGDGVHIGRVRVPEMVANLAFGGARRNRLFICGTTSLYAVYLKING